MGEGSVSSGALPRHGAQQLHALACPGPASACLPTAPALRRAPQRQRPPVVNPPQVPITVCLLRADWLPGILWPSLSTRGTPFGHGTRCSKVWTGCFRALTWIAARAASKRAR